MVEWKEALERSARRLTTLAPSGAILYAALPASARPSDNLVVWYVYKNTGSETANFRPVMYLVGGPSHAFSSRTLEPGQERGPAWMSCLISWAAYPVIRVDMGLEVETPEGWVEVEKRTGPPFSASATYLLPELIDVKAPSTVVPGAEVTIDIIARNPGYTNSPSIFYYVNGTRGMIGLPIIGEDTTFPYTFTMPPSDVGFKIQVSRSSPRGELINPDYRTVTITAGTSLEGYVKDAETLQPISSALVTCGSSIAWTDAAGYYKFDLSLGVYTVSVLAAGYAMQTRTVDISKPAAYLCNFTLEKATLEWIIGGAALFTVATGVLAAPFIGEELKKAGIIT